MIVYVVNIRVKPECLAAFRAASQENAAHSRQEPGIASFEVLQQQDDPTRFLLVEAYRDAAAIAAHKETAHYAQWRDAVAPLMAEPRVGLKYSPVGPAAG